MLKAFTGAALTNIVIQLGAIVTGPLVARLLGPQGRGELSVVMVWPAMMATIALLGTDIQLSRMSAQAPGAVRQLRRSALVLSLGVGTLCTALGYLLAPVLLSGPKSYLLSSARLAFSVVPASMLTVYCFSIALGRKDYASYNGIRMAFSGAYICGLIGLVIFRCATVGIVLLVYIGAATLTALISYYAIVRHAEPTPVEATNRVALRRLVVSSLPFGVGTASAALSAQAVPLVLSLVAEPKSIGIFVVAMTAASAHTAIASALGKVLFSHFSSTRHDAAAAWMRERARQAFALYILLSVVMIAILPLLVPLAFGSRYGASSPLVASLVPFSSFDALATLYDEALKGQGRAAPGITARLCSVCIVAAIGISTYPEFGHWGMVMAVGCGVLVQFAILMREVMRGFGLKFDELVVVRGADFLALAAFGAHAFGQNRKPHQT